MVMIDPSVDKHQRVKIILSGLRITVLNDNGNIFGSSSRVIVFFIILEL